MDEKGLKIGEDMWIEPIDYVEYDDMDGLCEMAYKMDKIRKAYPALDKIYEELSDIKEHVFSRDSDEEKERVKLWKSLVGKFYIVEEYYDSSNTKNTYDIYLYDVDEKSKLLCVIRSYCNTYSCGFITEALNIFDNMNRRLHITRIDEKDFMENARYNVSKVYGDRVRKMMERGMYSNEY